LKKILKITNFLLIIFLSNSALSQTNEELIDYNKINIITSKEKISHQVFEKVLPGVDFFIVKGKYSENSVLFEQLHLYNSDTICYQWEINVLTKELGSRSYFTINDLIKLYLFLDFNQLLERKGCINLNLDSINIINELIYTNQDSAEYNKFNYKATFNFCGRIKQILFYIENKQIFRRAELSPNGKAIQRNKPKIVDNLKSKSNFIISVDPIPVSGYHHYYTSPYETYEFPVKPGMEEWKNLSNNEERINVLQIPDSILCKISTKGLIVTCLNYPGLINTLACNNMFDGFEKVVSSFNGFQELLSREDLGEILIDHYQNMHPEKFDETYKDQEKYEGVFQYFGIEMLLCNYDILESLSEERRIQLIKILIEKLKMKEENPQNFGNLTKHSACLVIARTMSTLNIPSFNDKIQQNKKLSRLINTGRPTDVQFLDEFVLEVEKLIY
jgi:hypothetical protein